MNYNELSRRGLIKLNNDFDQENDNALKNYLDAAEDDRYEGIRIFEQVAEEFDETSMKSIETVREAISSMADSFIDKLADRLSPELDEDEVETEE